MNKCYTTNNNNSGGGSNISSDIVDDGGSGGGQGGGGFNDTSYDFQILTFETIVAQPTDKIEGTITNHIQISNNDGTTTTKREIVRNDFFRGIIPINVTETE